MIVKTGQSRGTTEYRLEQLEEMVVALIQNQVEVMAILKALADTAKVPPKNLH